MQALHRTSGRRRLAVDRKTVVRLADSARQGVSTDAGAASVKQALAAHGLSPADSDAVEAHLEATWTLLRDA